MDKMRPKSTSVTGMRVVATGDLRKSFVRIQIDNPCVSLRLGADFLYKVIENL